MCAIVVLLFAIVLLFGTMSSAVNIGEFSSHISRQAQKRISKFNSRHSQISHKEASKIVQHESATSILTNIENGRENMSGNIGVNINDLSGTPMNRTQTQQIRRLAWSECQAMLSGPTKAQRLRVQMYQLILVSWLLPPHYATARSHDDMWRLSGFFLDHFGYFGIT